MQMNFEVSEKVRRNLQCRSTIVIASANTFVLPLEPAEIQSEEIKIAGSPLEATILASMAPSMDSMQQQFSFIYLF